MEDVVHGIDSTMPQQEQERKYFETSYRSLLVAMQVDWAREAVPRPRATLELGKVKHVENAMGPRLHAPEAHACSV